MKKWIFLAIIIILIIVSAYYFTKNQKSVDTKDLSKYTTYESQVVAVMDLMKQTPDWYASLSQYAKDKGKDLYIFLRGEARRLIDGKGFTNVMNNADNWQKWY